MAFLLFRKKSPLAQLTTLARSLGGDTYYPGLSTAWQDSAGTTPASNDAFIGKANDLSGSKPATQTTTANKPQLRGTPMNWLRAPSHDFTAAAWSKIGTCTITGTNQINTPALNDGVTGVAFNFVPAGETITISMMLSGSGTIVVAFRYTNGTGAYLPSNANYVTLTATPTLYTLTSVVNDATATGVGLYIRRLGISTATQVTVSDVKVNLGSTALNPPNSVGIEISADSAPRWFQFAGDGTANDFFSTPIQTPATGYFACAAMFLGGIGTSNWIMSSGGTDTTAGIAMYRGSAPGPLDVLLNDGSYSNITGPNIPDGVPFVASFSYASGAQKLITTVSGATITTYGSIAKNASSTNTISIGKRAGTTSNWMNGFIGPVVWIPAAVTAAQDLRIRQLIGQIQQIPGVA